MLRGTSDGTSALVNEDARQSLRAVGLVEAPTGSATQHPPSHAVSGGVSFRANRATIPHNTLSGSPRADARLSPAVSNWQLAATIDSYHLAYSL